MSARAGRLARGQIKVDNITTRTSHYESFTVSGTGFILNGRLARGQARAGAARAQPPSGRRERRSLSHHARRLSYNRMRLPSMATLVCEYYTTAAKNVSKTIDVCKLKASCAS